MLKMTAVSYLNTKPFIYGLLKNDFDKKEVDISLDIPSQCAEKLGRGEASLGLAPVGALPELPQVELFSDFCIGHREMCSNGFLFLAKYQ
jgi:hypothetical protein